MRRTFFGLTALLAIVTGAVSHTAASQADKGVSSGQKGDGEMTMVAGITIVSIPAGSLKMGEVLPKHWTRCR